MSVQVGRCYYHPDRGAVAVCAECGAGVCRECAVKDGGGRVLCRQCGNEALKQEHKEYRKWLKESGGRFREGREFILPCIIGVLLVAVGGVATYFDGSLVRHLENGNIAEIIGFAYMLFSMPFGYIKVNDVIPPKYNSIFRLLICFFVTMMIGWIVFPFFVVRFIFRKIKPKQDKPQNTE